MQISLRVLLSLCLIFGQFKPGVANKSAAYKQAAIGEGKGKGVVGVKPLAYGQWKLCHVTLVKWVKITASIQTTHCRSFDKM